MKSVIRIMVAVVAAAGCNGLVAEPLRLDESSQYVKDIDPSGATADATYGCDMVQFDRDTLIESGITLLIDIGHVAVGGQCKQAAQGLPSRCESGNVWPSSCSPGQPLCGGTQGHYDEEADMSIWHGGAYTGCAYECQSDGDCPAPSTGSARASCVRLQSYDLESIGTCRLNCDNGETCPDDFICQPSTVYLARFESPTRGPRQCYQYVPFEYQRPGLPYD